MRFHNLSSIAAVLLALSVASGARAAYTVYLEQVGPDVIATGSGSLDTTSLSLRSGAISPFEPAIDPEVALIDFGTTETSLYTGASAGPSNFGTGNVTIATSTAGEGVGFDPTRGLHVPVGYVSGTQLGTTTATFSNATFASLGVTPGTYQYTIGSGTDTFNIITVPEPASLTLLGLGGSWLLARRRRQTIVAIAWHRA